MEFITIVATFQIPNSKIYACLTPRGGVTHPKYFNVSYSFESEEEARQYLIDHPSRIKRLRRRLEHVYGKAFLESVDVKRFEDNTALCPSDYYEPSCIYSSNRNMLDRILTRQLNDDLKNSLYEQSATFVAPMSAKRKRKSTKFVAPDIRATNEEFVACEKAIDKYMRASEYQLADIDRCSYANKGYFLRVTLYQVTTSKKEIKYDEYFVGKWFRFIEDPAECLGLGWSQKFIANKNRQKLIRKLSDIIYRFDIFSARLIVKVDVVYFKGDDYKVVITNESMGGVF